MLVTFAYCNTENKKVETVKSQFFSKLSSFAHFLGFSQNPLLSMYFGCISGIQLSIILAQASFFSFSPENLLTDRIKQGLRRTRKLRQCTN